MEATKGAAEEAATATKGAAEEAATEMATKEVAEGVVATAMAQAAAADLQTPCKALVCLAMSPAALHPRPGLTRDLQTDQSPRSSPLQDCLQTEPGLE